MFRSSFSTALFALCFAAMVCGSNNSHAVQTYCVGAVAELRTALDNAEAAGEDSRIDLRTGPTTSPASFCTILPWKKSSLLAA